ncbi:MAG: ABC transporter permease [Candidatus Asgardarchaeia archaeon]
MPNFTQYIIRRAITLVPTLLGLILITFTIGYIIPSDLARAWAGGIKARPEQIAEIAKKYHLHDPFFVQFYFFLVGILTNTLRAPTIGIPIFSALLALFPFTFQLATMAIIIALVIGVPVGVLAAIKKDTKIDYIIRSWSLSMNAMPAFFLAIIVRYVVQEVLKLTPPLWYKLPSRTITTIPLIDALLLGEFDIFLNVLYRFIWPALTLGLIYGGIFARFIRNGLLDVLNSEFITYLRAKGLPEKKVMYHAMKNITIPIITVVGFSFSSLLSGAVLVEIVFELPGIGSFAYQALFYYDVVIIMGTTLFFGFIVILTSFIIDIAYGFIDPRIRY